MIIKCNNKGCKHAAQDAMHGAGVRVHNATSDSLVSKPDLICTVCGNGRDKVRLAPVVQVTSAAE